LLFNLYEIAFLYPNFPLKDRIIHRGEPFGVLLPIFSKGNISVLNNRHVVVLKIKTFSLLVGHGPVQYEADELCQSNPALVYSILRGICET
jgi:hypothetical protein